MLRELEVVGINYLGIIDTSASGKGKGKIENMMKELALEEGDLDDVIFDEEDEPAEEDLRWMILARVHMDKDFNNYWFFPHYASSVGSGHAG